MGFPVRLTSPRWTGKGASRGREMKGLRGLFRGGFMDKATADAESVCDLTDRAAFGTQGLQLGRVYGDGLTAYSETLGAAVGYASFDSLPDEITFELRETGNHVEHQP